FDGCAFNPRTAASALPTPTRISTTASARIRRGCPRSLKRRTGAPSGGCGQRDAGGDAPRGGFVSASERSPERSSCGCLRAWSPPGSSFIAPHIALARHSPDSSASALPRHRQCNGWGANEQLHERRSEAKATLLQADVALPAEDDVIKQLDLQRLA